MHPRKPRRATTYFEHREILRQELFVEQYMNDIDMPDWYRGLSVFQLSAAHGLTIALRDDLEQDTTYRVRNVLNRIGLRPLIPKQKVHLTMKLSRGNDLAFLWFIKEMFYKSDETSSGAYNLNEQLLLTCIAHADLLYTLRGLDSILPPEQKPRRSQTPTDPFSYIDKQLKANKLLNPNMPLLRRRRRRQSSTIRKIYSLPYLNALRKPQPYGKSLTALPPDFLLRLTFLDVYKDPNFIIPNAANRWFADYEINYARHTANSIVNENLDEMFHLNIAKVPHAIFDAQVYRSLQLPTEPGIGSVLYQKKMLCAQHQALAELEDKLEHELRVIGRDKCLKYFDVEASKKQERIQRLRSQIENDINTHMQRFKQLTKKSQSSLLIPSVGNLQKCSKCSSNIELYKSRSRLYGGKENNNNKKREPQCRYVIGECGIERQEIKSKEKRKPLRERNINNATKQKCYRKTPCETEIIGDCLKNKKHWKSETDEIFIIPSNEKVKLPRLRRLCSCGCTCTSHEYPLDSTQDNKRNYNYGHTETPSSTCSGGGTNAYFDAPKKDKPYQFDYPHIFDMNSPYDPKHLRKMSTKAIAATSDDADDDKRETRYRSRKCKTKSKESLGTAINAYTEHTFNANVKRYNEANAENLGQAEKRPTNSAWTSTYYDPNDKELMHTMLKDGLKLLTVDKRYVLPTLPDAHKMPILRYWMYARYGKTYTTKELSHIFKRSLLIFRALNKKHLREKMITSDLIGRAIYTDYSCHDYLIRKYDHVRELYYRSVDNSIMEQGRRLFMAMSPYLCTGRPQNETIFAYIPARPADIHHFRVWNSNSSRRRSKKGENKIFNHLRLKNFI